MSESDKTTFEFDGEKKTEWYSIPLIPELAADQPCPPGHVVVVSCDGKRFAFNKKAFAFYSKFAQNVLGDADDEEIPLDNERADADTLAKFGTWLKHHETHPRSKQPVPMPKLWTIDMYFKDKWDIVFIRQDYFVGNDEDMTKHDTLMKLALLSSYLQCDPLTQMLSTYFGWQIKCAATLDDPISEVARWCGRESYTLEEAKDAMDWVRGALKGVEPGPRTSMQSDDEYSSAPLAATA